MSSDRPFEARFTQTLKEFSIDPECTLTYARRTDPQDSPARKHASQLWDAIGDSGRASAFCCRHHTGFAVHSAGATSLFQRPQNALTFNLPERPGFGMAALKLKISDRIQSSGSFESSFFEIWFLG